MLLGWLRAGVSVARAARIASATRGNHVGSRLPKRSRAACGRSRLHPWYGLQPSWRTRAFGWPPRGAAAVVARCSCSGSAARLASGCSDARSSTNATWSSSRSNSTPLRTTASHWREPDPAKVERARQHPLRVLPQPVVQRQLMLWQPGEAQPGEEVLVLRRE
eukprot:scaffold5873_cov66-Phaeocystis_antarctica.AAC.1